MYTSKIRICFCHATPILLHSGTHDMNECFEQGTVRVIHRSTCVWFVHFGWFTLHWLNIFMHFRMRCTNVTVYPKKYAHGFVVLCFVVVMQSFIMNSHEVFIHIHQGCFAGTGAIVRLLQCQWSKPDGYGKISQCITTTKQSKAKTVCIFLGIYCIWWGHFVRFRQLLWFTNGWLTIRTCVNTTTLQFSHTS